MSFFYKLKIQYDGSNYCGWQIQSGPEKTIQGELNKALIKISNDKELVSIGSGRTDSKVHAMGQIVRVETSLDIESEALRKGLNSLLPKDIVIISSEKSDSSFHPIFSAKKKTYKYQFGTDKIINPLLRNQVALFPYKLDIDLIEEGCKIFLGEHDFRNYQCKGTEVSSTVRNISKFNIDRLNNPSLFGEEFEVDLYCFEIEGNGFLKQMVRLMVGALIELGKGKISLRDIENSLKNPSVNKLGPTAPANGLCLVSVDY